MMKKILMWTLYAALVGILIFGAVNRTAAKIEPSGKPYAESSEGLSTGFGRGGSGKNEQPGGFEDEIHASNLEEHEWVTLSGVISSFSAQEMLVVMDNGETIYVAGRAWRFALEQGFDPRLGNQLTMHGYFENGEFEPAEINNLSTGQVANLRSETGRPLWAGNNTY
ncbi:MAG: hypothetical protein KAS84_03870 [Anaerolineales bacterium]|nr:hypothetical protein [Anaerolineales bacterium]